MFGQLHSANRIRAGLVLLLIGICCHAWAFDKKKRDFGQEATITVTGRITDEQGNPLAGVSVVIAGSATTVVTNAEGVYTLNALPKAKLLFRFVGYATQEVAVENRTKIDLQLTAHARALDDVIVVGYGTQKKSDVTGAVTSVSKERLNNMVRTDVVQLIQGAAAGLNVTTTAAGANPESGAVMLIRGRNSISASTEPLIVLDGVPFNGSLSDINPYDIESIEVLKDASSTAIYGSRASNGVILIQTKKGTRGKASIRYNGFYAIQEVANFPNLMTGDEYYQFKKNTINNGTDDDPSITQSELDVYNSGSYKSFTWKDLILRTGNSQQHNLSVSGGSDKSTYNVSLLYLATKGVAVNDQYKRATVRANVTSAITNWLTFGSNTMVGRIDNSGAAPSYIDLFNKSPLAVPFNPDGSINITPIADDPRKINPLENLLYDDLKLKYSATTSNYFNIVLPVKGLSYRLNTGLQYESSDKDWYRGSNTGKSGALKGESETNTGRKFSYLVENVLSYQQKFKKHNVFLTGLFSMEGKENRTDVLYGQGFANDFLSYYGITQASKIVPSYEYLKTKLISQMFRLNYAYDSRYLLTATVRRDGFSGFGADRKYGTFSSVALGWNISNENFFRRFNNVVNNLKLRLSYGENGNQAIQPFQTLSQLGGGDYINGTVTAPGYIPATIGTANLGWETTRSANIGLDFGLWSSRVTGEINVYRNRTYDLLLKRAISAVNGVNNVFQNIGKTRNEGIEFTLNANVFTGPKLSWIVSGNFAWIKTTIEDLYGDGKNDLANTWFLGQPIRMNYDYKFVGVWQTNEADKAATYGAKPGYAKYDDRNNNGVYDADDRQLIGSPEPNFTWGFTNTLKYRSFGLSVYAYGKIGGLKVNPYKDRNYLISRTFWTPDNPINDFWSNDNQATRYLGKGITPSVYENANFIRIRDITLSYTLAPHLLSHIGLSNADVFVTGKNLFTITRWGALDPELDNQRAVPLQREYIFGLNIRL